jgi:hypothetical protein
MARRLTKEAIRKLLTKGLTGWEAGKLLLQNLVDANCNKPSLLSDADISAIENAPMRHLDARNYNTLMG